MANSLIILFSNRFHHLLRRVGHRIAGDDASGRIRPAFSCRRRHCCLRAGRRAEVSSRVSFTAATMPVAMTLQSMMPPKMFTRMPFTFGSCRMILNAAVTCSLLAPPPTSRKFAGHAAEMLDDVHRRHRQARAVDEAGDAAVELDVIEVELAGLDFQRRFLVRGRASPGCSCGDRARCHRGRFSRPRAMTASLPSAQFDDAERIDFHQRRVAFPPGLINAGDEFRAGVEQIAFQVRARRRFCAPDTA